MDVHIILFMSVFALNFFPSVSVRIRHAHISVAFSIFSWFVAMCALILALIHVHPLLFQGLLPSFFFTLSFGALFTYVLLVKGADRESSGISGTAGIVWGSGIQVCGIGLAAFFLIFVPGFEWVGILGALPGAILSLRAIFLESVINTAVVLAEIFFIALWTLVFIRMAVAHSFIEQAWNGLLLATITVFGIVLGNELRKEVVDREEAERLTADLHKTNTVLMALDRQKSEFISVASHQLRTPITSIKGYASMLLENSFGAVLRQKRTALEKIYAASETLARLVEDFLTVSRIEQGQFSYQMEHTSLVQAAREAMDEVAPFAREKSILISIVTGDSTDAIVYADAKKIRQVFRNILHYAIRNTDEGFISISIETDMPRGIAHVSISDTGNGIAKEDITKLFDVPEDPKSWLSGLELFVAHEIVRAHGGRVWAESKGKEQGASFFLEFPLPLKDNMS